MWPLVGHNRITAYLERSLEKDALSHAYLFVGPKHIGKMTLAVILAQAVNCPAPARPCGECPSCLKIAANNHPDVQILRLLTADEAEDKKAKSELVIEQVRGLQHWASLPPYEGRCRVFIFEQAELLNEAAANCLLKVLEEPLPNVLFILLAPSAGMVPETISSRCQGLIFRPVPDGEIEDMLLGRGFPPDKTPLVVRLAAGAPGWALTAMEHDEVLVKRVDRLEKFLELVSQSYEERFEAAEEFAGKGAQGRNDAIEIVYDWQVLWRDLLIAQIGHIEGITNIDYSDKITSLGSKLSLADSRAFLGVLVKAEEWVNFNVNPRLIFEMLMLEMPLIGQSKTEKVI